MAGFQANLCDKIDKILDENFTVSYIRLVSSSVVTSFEKNILRLYLGLMVTLKILRILDLTLEVFFIYMYILSMKNFESPSRLYI